MHHRTPSGRTHWLPALALLLIGCALPVSGQDLPSPDADPPGGGPESASPASHPNAEGFAQRAGIILDGMAEQDLGTYRRGYFSGGDPGKYLPLYAMGRLLQDPQDPEALRYLNDDRAPRQHYHFAAVNWTRLIPMFADALEESTLETFADGAARYSAYLQPGGTENHKTMWMTSANVLPVVMPGDGRLAHQDRDAALANARQQLHDYVRGLYQAGQGEWDSSTYLMFDVNGMLNIYDFAEDPEVRLLARAALDWYAASYALKHVDGIFTAPHQRGAADEPHDSIADQTGYLWWGSDADITAEDTRGFRYTIHPMTSTWRPNRVLTNLAHRNLAEGLLPVQQHNTKPNYWYGQRQEPRAGAYRETVYIHDDFTMGSLWNGHGSQIMRHQVVVDTESGGVAITAGHPRQSDHTGQKTGWGYRDGNGRYLQSMQDRGTWIGMALTPEGDPVDYMFVSIPEGVEPQQHGEWQLMPIGDVVVAARGIGGELTVGQTDLTPRQVERNREPQPILQVRGQRVGVILEVLETSDLGQARRLLDMTELEASSFTEEMAIVYTTPDGRELTMWFQPAEQGDMHAARMARATVDGNSVQFEGDLIYSGPLVHQRDGVLTVSDGREAFAIDFSGEMPEYREAQPVQP
jgi:hypothetical protein